MSVKKVIDGDYCIGCGGCSVTSSRISIEEKLNGYTAVIGNEATLSEIDEASEVCPFSTKLDEDYISRDLYGNTAKYFERTVGYYNSIRIGHVAEGGFRSSGSSGGLTTWILAELLRLEKIDGVIHVGSTGRADELFSYNLSFSLAEVERSSKSRYYPVHFDDAIRLVKEQPHKRFAFVGVPCFVKALRLLQKKDELLNQSIIYAVSIFCGHLKTKAFAEMIGWQVGIPPSKLSDIDFRVKDPDMPANKYGIIARSEETTAATAPTSELFGMSWGSGYFKPKACEWCDDIAGETADMTCGDAWLPGYVDDPFGNNIAIIRNKELNNLVEDAAAQGRLRLDHGTANDVYDSQAGNYRHRQEGLSLRIFDAERQGVWHPTKRIKIDSFRLSEKRKKLYRTRYKISQFSKIAFERSKKANSFLIFVALMIPLEIKHNYHNGTLLGFFKKQLLLIGKYFLRKSN